MTKPSKPSAYEYILQTLDGYFDKALDSRKRLLEEPYDAKSLHAWRVNLRRVTATLKDVARFSDDDLHDVHAYLRECREATGQCRDIDILAQETLPNFLGNEHADSTDDTVRILAERQERAHAQALIELQKYDLTVPLRAWRHWKASLESPTRSMTRRLAATAIEQRYNALEKRVAKLDGGQKTLHRLRTATKKLRYTVELYAPVFPRQATAPWLKQLADMQEHLGLAHDRLMGRRLIGTLATNGDTKARKPFCKWAKRTAYEASKKAGISLARLEHLRHYWREHAN